MPTLTAAVRAIAGLIAVATLIPLEARAQGPNSGTPLSGTPRSAHAHEIAVPSADAVRRTAPIVLDGKLDDEAWKDATPIINFTQVDPDEGKPASQRTEMRFLFDDDALYIGAKMFDTAGRKGIRTSLVRRDQMFNSDYIEIVIDGFHDHLGRAFFDVNPSGSIQDQLGTGTSCCDAGWDPIWTVKTHIDDDGWTAEIRIPLNQLRFSRDSAQTWGLQLRRFILRRNELDVWSFWKKTEPGGPNRFGHLEGVRVADPGRHVELLPYVVAKTTNIAFAPGDPFNNGHQQKATVGLDLKYLLSSNLTLDATFNPDFGQVEVDPAVVNLSAFETSFPEKRPFFVANSSVFSFGGFNCYFCSNVSSLNAFYSRRIGRSPTGASLAQNAGPYADIPQASSILGAAKITGRTSNGFTIGLLEAVTNQETAQVQFASGARGTQEIEPLTNYFVGRLKKDFLQGNLVVGGILTSVIRKMDATFAPRLNAHSELLGGDMLYTWDHHLYSFRANLALSTIEGDARVIAARERSSARYFQRPDRGTGSGGFLSNRYDTTATTMRGAGMYMRLAKDAGDWLWETALNTRTPGFENNDIAFLTTADFIWYNANLMRYWSHPTKWYRDFTVIVGGQQQNIYEGDRTDRQVQLFLSTTTPQFWNVSAFYLWHPALLDDRLLRGGPVVQKPGSGYVEADVSSNSQHAVIFSGGAGYSTNTRGGWGNNAYFTAQFRPTSAVSMSFGPSWNNSRSYLQYVTAVNDPTATAFFGSRYVLSGLRQKSLALDTRLSMTFRPTMTLELYMQPFFATGHYFEFKEFNKPRQGAWGVYGVDNGTITAARNADGLVTNYTIDPDGAGPAQPFTISNPDFNLRSLRGNLVFRWEYRSGSTLYFAWTHSRSDVQPLGDFNFSRDEQGLLATRPDNILLIKASWWWAH